MPCNASSARLPVGVFVATERAGLQYVNAGLNDGLGFGIRLDVSVLLSGMTTSKFGSMS